MMSSQILKSKNTLSNMKFKETKLPGAFEIEFFHAEDQRGTFVKTFQNDDFEVNGVETNFKESFYSVSKKNVIRGMHFQLPPEDHSKLVYVTSGKIIDVVMDLRKASPTFKEYISVELSGENHKGLYIPRGMAHGFAVLEENTTMIYLTTTVHNKDFDSGIRWDSFGMEWPVKKPVISERDKNFEPFEDFQSPF